MSEIKLNLSIVLPGRTMYSQQVAENKPELLKTESFTFSTYNKKNKKSTKETLTYQVRTCIPAKQSINICKEAYYDMISNSCPNGVKPSDWKRMSKKERLEYNLNEICEGLGGVSYSYKVFND